MMEKVLNLVKNKWFRLGVSAVSLVYVWFCGYIAWLVFAYYLKPTNNISLFALYLFLNFLFGAVLFFTRKTIVTKIVVMIIPFEVFFLWIAGFGEWFITVPPLAVCIFAFFAAKNSETLKTVLGTILLLVYVVGSFVYMTLLSFNITLDYMLTRDEIDISQRHEESYLMSKNGTYRLVEYIETSETRTTHKYYVEIAAQDVHLAFLDAYRVFGCKSVLASVYTDTANPKWISDTKLEIDGKVRDMDDVFSDKEEDESVVLTTSVLAEAPEQTTTGEETTTGDEE